MGFSHSDLVSRFENGKTCGQASNMFIEGDVMYSYGHHFPLVVRTPWGNILNADKYSSSTSGHQFHCRNLATIQVPFSALSAAGLISYGRYSSDSLPEQFKDVWLLDHDEARYDLIGYSRYDSLEGKMLRMTVKQWSELSAETQEQWSEVQERRPEAALLKFGEWHYLSSMDGGNYFISKLPEQVETVKEAFESLKPIEVDGLTECDYPQGRGVQYTEVLTGQYARQGEWFFTPCHELPISLAIKGKEMTEDALIKKLYKTMQHDFVLPKPDSSSHDHIATRGDVWNEGLYVSGSIRHTEHRMLRLCKADKPRIFLAFRNRAVNSWSASGNVD